MSNLQAALGLAQLERIDELLEKKQHIFEEYRKHLPIVERHVKNVKDSHWMITVLLDMPKETAMEKLKEKGIDTRPVFYPLSVLKPYKHSKADTPIAKAISKKGINLPSGACLTDEEIQYICKEVLAL